MSSSNIYEKCDPDAASTIESLRRLNYDLGIASADIIDNSISAGATKIRIIYKWDLYNSYIKFIDNGFGMNKESLFKAMKLGSHSFNMKRNNNDLGRFGLGLKTASWSQCDKLTVLSKQNNSINYKIWDLKHVQKVNLWELQTNNGNIELLKDLDSKDSGTIVLWENLEFIDIDNEEPDIIEENFYKYISKLENFLSMIFHRYIEKNKITIEMGHSNVALEKIKAWNPFLPYNQFTEEIVTENISFNDIKCNVSGFALPHHSNFNHLDDHVKAGGLYGWNKHQGFYIYRNDRLIQWGGWCNLWKQEDHYKLARIAVEIPNSLDKEFKIKVSKINPEPPPIIINQLKRIGKITRNRAKAIYSFRGAIKKRENSEEKKFIWKIKRLRNNKVSYFVDKSNKMLKNLISSLNLDNKRKKVLNLIISLIEGSVPVETIVVQDRESPDSHVKSFSEAKFTDKDIKELYDTNVELYIKSGMLEEEAHYKTLEFEPFLYYKDDLNAIYLSKRDVHEK